MRLSASHSPLSFPPSPVRLFFGLVQSLALVLLLSGQALASAGQGIVLVAFGTTMPEAGVSLDALDRAYRERYPDVPVIWAYSSDIVRKRLAEKGVKVPSVREALDQCVRNGLVDVRVQSFHVTAAEEFSMLERALARYVALNPKVFDHLWLGRPLLVSLEDMDEVRAAVLADLPKDRGPDDLVLLMGHGNDRGPGDLVLAHVRQAFHEGDPRVFLATVEGGNSFDALLPKLSAHKGAKVYLQPFMVVAGDHARNDLAGPEADSWASRLKEAGLRPVPRLKGLGEIPGVQEVFLRHTRETRDDLANTKKEQ